MVLAAWVVRVVVAAEVGRTGAPAAIVVVLTVRGRQEVEGPQDMLVGQQPPPREEGQEV